MILKYLKNNSIKLVFVFSILIYVLTYITNETKKGIGILSSNLGPDIYLSNNCTNFENSYDFNLNVCRESTKDLELFFPGVVSLYRVLRYENFEDFETKDYKKFDKIHKKKSWYNYTNYYLLSRFFHDKTSYFKPKSFYNYFQSRDQNKLNHSIYLEYLTDFETLLNNDYLLIKGIKIENIYDYSFELNKKNVNFKQPIQFTNKGLSNQLNSKSILEDYCLKEVCQGKTIFRLFINIDMASDEDALGYHFSNDEINFEKKIIKSIKQNQFYESYISTEIFNEIVNKNLLNSKNDFLIQFASNKQEAKKIENTNKTNYIQIFLTLSIALLILLNKNIFIYKARNLIFLLIIYLFWSLNLFENNFILFELSIFNIALFLILLLLHKRLNIILIFFLFIYIFIILADINIAYVTNLFLIIILEIFYLRFIFQNQKT